VDVVTEGGLIEKGARVKVVGIEGMRVVVREALPAELADAPAAPGPGGKPEAV
jgi:membrane-bound ClpP family serine protease